MRTLDIKKTKKIKPVQSVEPKLPKSKQKPKKEKPNFYIVLAYVILMIIIVLGSWPLIKSLNLSYDSSTDQATSAVDYNSKDQITIYINSNNKDEYEQIRQKLKDISQKITFVYRKDPPANIIYYGASQGEQAVKIQTGLAIEFELKESTSAETTGIVVYYKK